MSVTAIERAVARWTNPTSRPLFKGKLIDRNTGCMCAQGDVLFNEGGISAEELASMAQSEADKRTMDLLGISRAHSVLLRNINDRGDGQPQNVLSDPASVLGKFAPTILAFWHHLDKMTWAQWQALGTDAYAAYAYAYAAYAYAAYAAAAYADAAAYAAADAAYADAADAAAAYADADAAAYRPGWKARNATYEIIGQEVMIERGKPFYFLKLFGFDSPSDILA